MLLPVGKCDGWEWFNCDKLTLSELGNGTGKGLVPVARNVCLSKGARSVLKVCASPFICDYCGGSGDGW